MKNFISPGDVVEVTAPYDVLSGAGCLVGSLFGIAATDALSGAAVNIATRGAFEVKKKSDEAWSSVGAAIYWDNSNKRLTTTSSGNTLVAKNLAVAADPSSTGTVRLNG